MRCYALALGLELGLNGVVRKRGLWALAALA